jgi:hypothetical protein
MREENGYKNEIRCGAKSVAALLRNLGLATSHDFSF